MPLLIIQLALLIAVIYIVFRLISGNRKPKNSDESVINAASALSSPAEKQEPSEILENDADAAKPVVPVEVVTTAATIEATAEAAGELPVEPKKRTVKEPSKAASKTVTEVTASIDDSVKLNAAPVASTGRPQGRDTARRGKPDDLTRIKGVGKALQEKMFGLGVFHFDQIAEWTPEQAAWVGAHMSFPGRIEREDWIAQAASLIKSSTKPAAAKSATAKTSAKPKAKASVKPATAKRAKPAQAKKP